MIYEVAEKLALDSAQVRDLVDLDAEDLATNEPPLDTAAR